MTQPILLDQLSKLFLYLLLTNYIFELHGANINQYEIVHAKVQRKKRRKVIILCAFCILLCVFA